MNVITCPECRSKYDASSFEPGSDFTCANCSQILRVPGEAPAVAAAPAGAGMSLLRCHGCGSKFDVSGLEPGSPFPCASCRLVLEVPGEWVEPIETVAPVAPPRAAPRRAAPAAPARPKGKPAPPAKRPAAAAKRPAATAARRPAREPARPERARPERAQGRRPAAPARAARSSNTPLLLGLGGVGLVAIIVAIVLVAGGGGDEPDTPAVPGPSAQKPPKPRTPTDPARMSRVQKLTLWRDMRIKAMVDDSEKAVRIWLENHEWATRYRMSQQATEALEAVVKLDPQNDVANEKLGRKLFRYRYMPGADDMEVLPFEDKDLLVAAVEKGKGDQVWVTQEEYDELEELQRREKEHRDKLENDVRYKWTKFWIGAVERDPGYRDYDFEVNEDYPPYLVFVQDTGRKLDKALTEKVVRRNGLMFKCLYEQWTRVFEPEIRKLPEYRDFRFPPLGVTKGQNSPPILKVWVFLNEKDFREYIRKIGSGLPASAKAYYRLPNQWITLYEGGSGESTWFGQQTFNNGKVFHEGAHQLNHYYAKLVWSRECLKKGDPAKDFEDVPSNAFWFSEGMAELFGGADEVAADEKWECFRPLHSRIWEYRHRLRGAPGQPPLVWTLEEVVRMRNNVEIIRKWIPRKTDKWRDPQVQGGLVSLFYAQAWTFCYYLWNADGGKHREIFVRYFMKEMTGESGFAAFEPLIKPLVDEAGGWAELEKKVIAYLQSLPRVRPGRFRAK